MARQAIKVTVNMPTTPEGIAQLQAAAREMNSRIIANVLNSHAEIPMEAKRRFLSELNGKVPWLDASRGNTSGRAAAE